MLDAVNKLIQPKKPHSKHEQVDEALQTNLLTYAVLRNKLDNAVDITLTEFNSQGGATKRLWT